MQLKDLLNRFQRVRSIGQGEYEALCPAHADKNPSLHITEKNGKILLHCKAGCKTEDIVRELGISMSDLYLAPQVITTTAKIPEKLIDTYDYKDEAGNLLFQVLRYEPKTFKQRCKDSEGNWTWRLNGVRRVLYHVDNLVNANPDTPIYLTEGEKDCDNLWMQGLVATTSPGGAQAWRDEYANALAGHKVVLIPDNDKPGLEYARTIAKSLKNKASVKVILLDGVKDVSDWLDNGGLPDDLPGMEQDISVLFSDAAPRYSMSNGAIEWQKRINEHSLLFRAENTTRERIGIHSRISVISNYNVLGWSYFNIERSEARKSLASSCATRADKQLLKDYPLLDLQRDLDAFTHGLWAYHVGQQLPEIMSGDGGNHLITYLLKPHVLDGGGTILFAPPGRGKSYSALIWAASIHHGVNRFWSTTKAPVLFINLERSRQSVQRRLGKVNQVLGLPANAELPVLNARGKSLNDVVPACQEFISEHNTRVIFLDSISRAGFGDLNENKPVNTIVDALSNLSETWVALAHTPRADKSHVYGSIHFDAGADLIVQLNSELKDDGTLGVGYQSTKQNDAPPGGQEIFAMTFNEYGLSAVRKAKRYEFPQIEENKRTNTITALEEYITCQDAAETTASQAALDLGIDRTVITKLLRHSGKFEPSRTEGHNKFYTLKGDACQS